MPFFNGNKFLREAISSVAAQDLESVELIIAIDTGSEKPLFDAEEFPFVRVVGNTSGVKGAGGARFAAICAAKHRFLAFLDADDVWYPNKLSTQISQMLDHRAGFCFTSYDNFGSSGPRRATVVPCGSLTTEDLLTKRIVVGCLTVVVDRAYLPILPLIDLKRRNDYMLWYVLLTNLNRLGVRSLGLPQITAAHRFHRDSLTASIFKSGFAYYWFVSRLDLSSSYKFYVMAVYTCRMGYRRLRVILDLLLGTS